MLLMMVHSMLSRSHLDGADRPRSKCPFLREATTSGVLGRSLPLSSTHAKLDRRTKVVRRTFGRSFGCQGAIMFEGRCCRGTLGLRRRCDLADPVVARRTIVRRSRPLCAVCRDIALVVAACGLTST